MACGLYGKPLGFTPMLTSASEIFAVFPNGPQVTMKLKVKEIGPVNKQNTQFGARTHCVYTLVGQDEAVTIRGDCWQDHINTCLAALPIGTCFSITFCPKTLPPQLIIPQVGFCVRLNTECQISDIVPGPPATGYGQVGCPSGPAYYGGMRSVSGPVNYGQNPDHTGQAGPSPSVGADPRQSHHPAATSEETAE